MIVLSSVIAEELKEFRLLIHLYDLRRALRLEVDQKIVGYRPNFDKVAHTLKHKTGLDYFQSGKSVV